MLWLFDVDVGQMMIVYEDEDAMDNEEGAAGFRNESFPSYYHSGITPPMKRVLDRRFAVREHTNKAPPKHEIVAVEQFLKGMISTIDVKKPKKMINGPPPLLKIVTPAFDASNTQFLWRSTYPQFFL